MQEMQALHLVMPEVLDFPHHIFVLLPVSRRQGSLIMRPQFHDIVWEERLETVQHNPAPHSRAITTCCAKQRLDVVGGMYVHVH